MSFFANFAIQIRSNCFAVAASLLLWQSGAAQVTDHPEPDRGKDSVDLQETPVQRRGKTLDRAKATSTRFAHVSKGTGRLPNSAGQIWREYDIRPFVSRNKDVEKPERQIIDWILRETGADLWFGEPLGILSANSSTLRVYHTPDVQKTVGRIVDRLINSAVGEHAVSVRMFNVSRPDWRKFAWPFLHSVKVNSPGVEAWELEEEDAAMLLAQLQTDVGFRQQADRLSVLSGETKTLRQTWLRRYTASIERPNGPVDTFRYRSAEIPFGYTVQVSPLAEINGRMMEVALRCQCNQIERTESVNLPVQTAVGPKTAKIEVPQIASWSLHERFRWPTDKALLISRGIVAAPRAPRANENGLSKLLPGPSRRAEVLFLLEYQQTGKSVTASNRKTNDREQLEYRGRY